MLREINSGKGYIGRLNIGDDLLKELLKICREQDVNFGRVEAIGAVQKAQIRYFQRSTLPEIPAECHKTPPPPAPDSAARRRIRAGKAGIRS